jgi:mannose-6-phosphate isomerase-like protein (cupin superfamily)
MDNFSKYIESGILELYVLGLTTEAESIEIEALAEKHEEILKEIEKITQTLEIFSESKAPPLNPTLKTFLLATIDYSERIKNGEIVSFPPVLSKDSRADDFSQWLCREDMALPEDFREAHAKIIGYTPQMTTAIVWLRTMSPPEIHTDEFEKFLIIEGTCDLTIGEKTYQLGPGDYLDIPLHIEHKVIVTSDTPCKFILQRIAA